MAESGCSYWRLPSGISLIVVTWTGCPGAVRNVADLDRAAGRADRPRRGASVPQLLTAAVVLTDVAARRRRRSRGDDPRVHRASETRPRSTGGGVPPAIVAGSGRGGSRVGCGRAGDVSAAPSTDIPSSARVMLVLDLVVPITTVAWLPPWWRNHDTGVGVRNLIRAPVVIGACTVDRVGRGRAVRPFVAARRLPRSVPRHLPGLAARHRRATPAHRCRCRHGSIGW